MALSNSIGIEVTASKIVTKLKLRDRKTLPALPALPACLVSYTGAVLSLLWPSKFLAIFQVGKSEQWENAYGTLLM